MKPFAKPGLFSVIVILIGSGIHGYVLQRVVSSRRSPSLGTLLASSVCCILDNEGSTPGITMTALASELNLAKLSKEELLLNSECIYTHFLTCVPYQFDGVEDYALAIASLDRGGKRPKINMKPFFVDFFPPANSRLGKRASGESGRDLLIKAVGLPNRGISNITVYDLTAGFGQDSLLMAKNGARKVHMVERNPIVACLLKDALRRLVVLSEATRVSDQGRKEASWLASRLHLIQNDGVHVANAIAAAKYKENRPDIIYLDPMFPER